MIRIRGWSTSGRDIVWVAGVIAGAVTAMWTARSVGGAVVVATDSLWLGSWAWVGTLVAGTAVFVGSLAALLTESRSYRAPARIKPLAKVRR